MGLLIIYGSLQAISCRSTAVSNSAIVVCCTSRDKIKEPSCKLFIRKGTPLELELMFMKHYAPNRCLYIKVAKLRTGVGSAEMSHLQNCSLKIYLKRAQGGGNSLKRGRFSSLRIEFFVKIQKKKLGGGGGGRVGWGVMVDVIEELKFWGKFIFFWGGGVVVGGSGQG